MVGSVNTNLGAQIALQNLNVTGADLASVQKQVSTGLKVSDAFDNGAVFAIAQGLQSDVSAIAAVNAQLGGAKGNVNVALAATQSACSVFNDIRSVAIQLADQNVTGNQRSQLNSQYVTQCAAIKNYFIGANYNGSNLVDGSTVSVSVIKDTSAAQYQIFGYNLLGAANTYFAGSIPTQAQAQALLAPGGGLDQFKTLLDNETNSLASDAHFLENQITFNNSISDATTNGLGSLVDADLAKQSARLQSLQIKQQLGTQSLGIANQAPQSLLGLFR